MVAPAETVSAVSAALTVGVMTAGTLWARASWRKRRRWRAFAPEHERLASEQERAQAWNAVRAGGRRLTPAARGRRLQSPPARAHMPERGQPLAQPQAAD